MHIVAVSIGKARALKMARGSRKTGIFKEPQHGEVRVQAEGMEGDEICNTKHHGGPDQAVYLYGTADYAWWATELGRTLEPGTFGENLTISGLACADYAVGDYFHIGDVILQVTSVRIPCSTLAARMGDPQFVKRFRSAERPGLYCRVLREGEVEAGDEVSVVPYEGDRIPILELFRDFYLPARPEATLRRHLAAPIAIRDREAKEAELAEIMSEG